MSGEQKPKEWLIYWRWRRFEESVHISFGFRIQMKPDAQLENRQKMDLIEWSDRKNDNEAVWPHWIKSNAFESNVSFVTLTSTTLNAEKIVSGSFENILRENESHFLWLLLNFNLVEWANSFISKVLFQIMEVYCDDCSKVILAFDEFLTLPTQCKHKLCESCVSYYMNDDESVPRS